MSAVSGAAPARRSGEAVWQAEATTAMARAAAKEAVFKAADGEKDVDGRRQ
jgi:hypothetical protein